MSTTTETAGRQASDGRDLKLIFEDAEVPDRTAAGGRAIVPARASALTARDS